MSPRLALITFAAALTLVSASAGASSSAKEAEKAKDAIRLEAARANAGEAKDSVRFLRPIDGYEVLGDHSVLVWETNTKAWLVDVRANDACQERDLDNSIAIGIDSKIHTMNTSNAYIVGKYSLRCKITQIREVDVPAMRAAERQVATAN